MTRASNVVIPSRADAEGPLNCALITRGTMRTATGMCEALHFAQDERVENERRI
jgi:hypothetical protein